MDVDGAWRPPAEWPEDYPPLVGWERDATGRWHPPADAHATDNDDKDDNETDTPVAPRLALASDYVADPEIDLAVNKERPIAEPARSRSPLTMSKYRAYPDTDTSHRSGTATLERAEAKTTSLQAKRDIRAMLLVGGAIGVAVLLLIAALVLQSRAGAAAPDAATPTELAPPEVIFAAETEAVREQRRQDARLIAPAAALAQLETLEVREGETDAATSDESNDDASVDESLWVASSEGCLDVSERVLIDRSLVPIVFADNLQCVPSEGRWTDSYLSIDMTRTIDTEVRSLVPLDIVISSGGSQWTPATRDQFLNDTAHPATLLVLAADSGHNPRNASPDVWRPSNEATWCGYGIDWIAVKARWELTVTPAESAALAEMLSTCDQPGSTGAHASSMVIDPIAAPTIERTES